MAFPAEIAPSQGYLLPGQTPDGSWPKDFSARKEPEISYSHPLQQRIAYEWMPQLLEDGEGCPARRLEVFVDRVDKFSALTSNLSPAQLDGDMDPELMDEVAKQASYIKQSVMGAVTPLRIDVGSFMDRKMMEKMQHKYPPDDVYQLIKSGMTPLEAMAYLKDAYSSGLESFIPHVEVPEEEWAHRVHRNPAFADPYQDVADTWQRRAFGKHIRAGERLPNLFGEVAEFLDEFKGMSEFEINSFVQKGEVVTANESEGEDSVRDKLISIAGEAADVVIAVDGYTAALGRDQEKDGNAALDRTILKYRKTKRLIKEGMSEEGAMRFLREVEYRLRNGLRLPYATSPAIAAIIDGMPRH